LPLAESHTGAALLLARHSLAGLAADWQGAHWLARQTGFAGSAVHSLLCTQATQRPVVVSQTPALTPPSPRAEHWLLVVHATHRLFAHTGLAGSAAQSVLCTQATHRPLVVSQTPVAVPLSLWPAHSVLAVHLAHWRATQMGRLVGQSLSLPQLPWPSTGRVSTGKSAGASTGGLSAGASAATSADKSAAASVDPSGARSAAASIRASDAASTLAVAASVPASSRPPASVGVPATSVPPPSTARTQRKSELQV